MWNLRARICATAGILFVLAGCSTSPRLTQNPLNEIQIDERLAPPRPGEAMRAAIDHPYVVGPLDVLEFRIVNFQGYDTETQVDTSGRVQLPLVGSVVVAGKTPADLAAELTRAYEATFLRGPQVAVTVKEIKSSYVAVEGSVRTPGVYQLAGPIRLNSALALAQGTSEFAALDNVAIFRMIDGKQHAAIFNLKDIRRGRYEEPMVYPSDTIVVGESSVRRMFRDIIQTAPFIAVFRPFR